MIAGRFAIALLVTGMVFPIAGAIVRAITDDVQVAGAAGLAAWFAAVVWLLVATKRNN